MGACTHTARGPLRERQASALLPPRGRERRVQARKRQPYSWAELFKRVVRLDVLVCHHCGGPRELLAAILERDAIRNVLAHLGIATEPPPTVAPARPPASHDDLLFA